MFEEANSYLGNEISSAFEFIQSRPMPCPGRVLVHGWILNKDEWAYAKVELAREHRVIVWDLPGLGNSAASADGDLSQEKMARDLDAVVEAVSFSPVVLAGHSIGGMIILTYCKLFPNKLTTRVRALVIAHSTYTNPVNTTRFSSLMQAIEHVIGLVVDRLVEILELALFEPILNSALAAFQLSSYLSVHSKLLFLGALTKFGYFIRRREKPGVSSFIQIPTTRDHGEFACSRSNLDMSFGSLSELCQNFE